MNDDSNLAVAIKSIVPTDPESARALIRVVDDFCPHFQQLRQEAVLAESNPFRHEGILYPDMARSQASWAEPLFQLHLGPVARKSDYYRLYRRGSKQQTYIHSDIGIADLSAILSLGDPDHHNGSIVFWRHKKTGWILPGGGKVGDPACEDGLYENRWEAWQTVEMAANRCVVFPAVLYHSRYPNKWNKNYPRKVQVFFLNILSVTQSSDQELRR